MEAVPLICNQAGISVHDKIASFYHYRSPYLADFFLEISVRLKLGHYSKLLDLCCGRGELSEGLSKYVGTVSAVDGSKKMLSHSINKDNISYHLCDVNQCNLPFVDTFDCIAIGTAIHWVRDYALLQICNLHLNPGGYLLITHRGLDFSGEKYFETFESINQRFGKKRKRKLDLTGRSKLLSLGFDEVDSMRMTTPVSLDLNFLYMNQLSLAYGNFYKKTFHEPLGYKNALMESMRPFANEGGLHAKLFNFAVIYKKQREFRVD